MNPLDPGQTTSYVYALSTCPWCHKTKEWFTDQKVDFEASTSTSCRRTNEADGHAAKAYELSGSRGFPVVVIYGEAIVGFTP